MPSARERLTRLLSLVPYLSAHPGADLEETAALFGIDSDTLIDDLQLLFVTGRPGHMPDDLIDASWEGGSITVSNAEEVSVPVRLSAEEAGVLVLALELVDSLPGLDTAAVRSAAAKLRAAAGQNLRAPVDVTPLPADGALLSFLSAAIDDQSAVAIDYYVASRDELTHRVIAPSALVPGDGWYVDAWCYLAGAPRRFNLAQIRGWTGATHPPLHTGHNAAEAIEVRIGLSAAGAWLADELEPLEREYSANGDGSLHITVLVHSRDWLSRFLLRHADVVESISDPAAVENALARLEEPAETRPDGP